MHFLSFTIRNFKGISEAQLDLEPVGANVFTLIGLNESGKTTILEAIRAFSWFEDRVDAEALYDRRKSDDPSRYVPKFDKSNFTGVISITARIRFNDSKEKDSIINHVEEVFGLEFDKSTVPDEFEYMRGFNFINSDFDGYRTKLGIVPQIRKKKARKFAAIPADAWKVFAEKIRKAVPHIVYFPTFLFEIPQKIVINPGDEEKKVNQLYREIIDSAAASLSRPLSIQTHIVDRFVHKATLIESAVEAALNFFALGSVVT